MKNVLLILLVCLLGASFSFAQKSKIKGIGPTTKSDSVQQGGGKAAVRAGVLMQASRDSLHSTDLQPPVEVVDTFGVEEATQWGKSYLKKSEIIAAEKRMLEAKQMLQASEKQFEVSKNSGRFTETELTASQQKLDDYKLHLAAAEAKLKSIRKDWETVTGAGKKPSSKDGANPKTGKSK